MVLTAATNSAAKKSARRHDLRATFCTRLALAGYEALTIMSLMGHKDLKTTMRYIRAMQLQRNVRFQEFWSQISHANRTAASVGSRKLLILMVGARGFEPPTSRSQTERTTRLCYAPKLLFPLNAVGSAF